jgi:hypothetical protein
MACFTGSYPMDVPQELDKLALEPPAWARDGHDVDWEPSQPLQRRFWETAPTGTPGA